MIEFPLHWCFDQWTASQVTAGHFAPSWQVWSVPQAFVALRDLLADAPSSYSLTNLNPLEIHGECYQHYQAI
jgi:hypothetical protein